MGKAYYFYVQNNIGNVGGPIPVATFTKVEKMGTPGQTTEGVIGVANTTYGVGWICTSSANPTSASGITVAVTRIGSD